MKKIIIYLQGIMMLLLSACVEIPSKYKNKNQDINIYPDYKNVFVPCNIAPLNFAIKDEVEGCVVKVTAEDGTSEIISDKDKKIIFDKNKWKNLVSKSVGGCLKYEVYAETKGKWWKYNDFNQHIVEDSINKYVTYRLIEPIFTSTGDMGLYQFDLEEGEEKTIYDDSEVIADNNYKRVYCVNCHTSQQNNPQNKLFYVRGRSGIVLTYNGETKIIDTKCGDMKNSTSYSQFHPTLPYVLCLTEIVRQYTYTANIEKMSSHDVEADLLLYDIEKNEIVNAIRTKDKIESWFSWSPDGKYAYYGVYDTTFTPKRPDLMKYDIRRMTFHPETRSFDNDTLIYSPKEHGLSAVQPKISPDGKYMLFRMSRYGSYMQNSRTSAFFVMNMESGEVSPLDSLNTGFPVIFHDWSKNGRWILDETKKDDGNYTRLYFSYFDKNGVAHKPFMIPRENPLYDYYMLKSYNFAEFADYDNAAFSTDYYLKLFRDCPELKATFASKIDSTNIDGKSGASQVDGESGASQIQH